jgi:hypothetical protein
MMLAFALHCLVIAGLGGEQEYETRFTGWAQTLEATFKAAGSDVKTEVLHGPSATRDAVRTRLRTIAAGAAKEDAVMLILIGHGSFDGAEYKFNLPGPDMTATELSSLLDKLPVSRQLVVNTTSSSGGALDSLAGANRTVIAATKSGTEKNATVFARYWVDAMRDGAADTDKNEVISAAEAFRYAETKTKQFYETQKRIVTEHPVMQGDGRFAVLRIGSVQEAYQRPEKRALLSKREQLEAQIEELKLLKAAMPAAEYRKELQALLISLARTQQELDK